MGEAEAPVAKILEWPPEEEEEESQGSEIPKDGANPCLQGACKKKRLLQGRERTKLHLKPLYTQATKWGFELH